MFGLTKKNKGSFEHLHSGVEYNGHEIDTVFYRRKSHIIYSAKGSSLINYASESQQGKLSLISDTISAYNQKLPRDIDRIRFNFDLASAIHMCFEGDHENVKNFALDLKKEIISYHNKLIQGRVLYVLTFMVTLVSLWISLYQKGIFPGASTQSEFEELLLCVAFGASGGFLTLISRLASVDFYYNKYIISHIITSLSRVLIAMLGGGILYVIIKSDIAFGFLDDISEKNIYIYLVFATLAGMSEGFIPNILGGLERK